MFTRSPSSYLSISAVCTAGKSVSVDERFASGAALKRPGISLTRDFV